MRLPLSMCAALAGLACAGGAHASFSFSDNFNPPSPQWNSKSGSWTASNGDYYAQFPNNNPFARSFLPFAFTPGGDTFKIRVNNLGDGGIFLKSTTSSDWLLFVFGGAGYGQGVRGGAAGTSAYWATSADPTAAFDDNTSAFTPGASYKLKMTVSPTGKFKVYKKVGTSFVSLTAFLDPSLTSFKFGLYDDQPNTTTGSGFGPVQSFSVLRLASTGTVTAASRLSTAAAVPEPATWALIILGLGGAGASLRMRRRAAVQEPRCALRRTATGLSV